MTEPTLTGLFFTQHCDDHFHVGTIVRQVHPDAYLVKFDRPNAEMPVDLMALLMIGDLSDTDDDGYPIFHFFETREDLRSWLQWLDTPTNPTPDNVTRIDKKERRH